MGREPKLLVMLGCFRLFVSDGFLVLDRYVLCGSSTRHRSSERFVSGIYHYGLLDPKIPY